MSKITGYAALTSLDRADQFVIVDVSDTTMASSGTTKKMPAGRLRGLSVFWLDDYGADNTGATSSDAAWTAAYADALASVVTVGGSSLTTGALIVMGGGCYTFSVNTVSTTDARIGFVGQGNAVTAVRTTGNTGTLLNFGGGSEPGTTSGAPVGGFTMYGWDAGNAVVGLAYHDRSYGVLFDIYANGFSGTNSKGFYFNQTLSSGVEGVEAYGLTAKTCTYGFHWDGNGSNTGSADYSRWNVHFVGCGTSLYLSNHANFYGTDFSAHGNVGSANFATSTLLAIGASGTDTSYINFSRLHLGVEVNSGSTTVNDFVIQGSSAQAGLYTCYGIINLLANGGTWTAGSLGSGRFGFFGPVGGSPLLNGAASGIDATARIDRSTSIAYRADSAQALSSSGTILTATHGVFGLVPVTETAAVTGMILEAPSRADSQITIVNRSAFTITFAASGTSHVADGATSAIPANTARSFVYDSGTSLWYRLA